MSSDDSSNSTIRVFVSEAVCGGGWPDGAPEGSLRREGEAMLTAVVRDFARLDGCRVTTTWDARLGPFPVPGVEAMTPRSPDEERDILAREAARADATLIIAPEFHDMLVERVSLARSAGARVLGTGRI